MSDEIRVGVYICHCGGNIGDVVDVAKLAEAVAKHPNVVAAKTNTYMCSDPGQQSIVDDIKANGVNRVVVAACALALHEQTFRAALERAGLNRFLYEHVNVREQVSWVHKNDPGGATRKAIRLVRAGIEKVILQGPLEPIRLEADRHVVVIGAGVAGMRAACSLGMRGLSVTLLEEADRVGGRLLELDTVAPTGERAAELVAELERAVAAQPGIEVVLNAAIEKIDGYVGNFTVRFSAGGQTRENKAGAIVMATGFDHYEPLDGEFGCHLECADMSALCNGPETQIRGLRENQKREGLRTLQEPGVLTLPKFNELLRQTSKGAVLRVGDRVVQNVAFIHCVGSRQVNGIHSPQADGKVNEYCSRFCCTAALHTIAGLLARYPDLNVYSLYKDIRTYGRGHEEYYEQASKKGVLFFRYDDQGLPELIDGKLKVRDWLTWGEELEIPVDLVVLVTGVVPRDISDIVGMMKLPVGTDRFLQEVHPKLRPVELANRGVLLAGCAQGPMDVLESCTSAEAAAAKAAILLSGDAIELDPFVAQVHVAKCDGCARCIDECSYPDALAMVGGKAVVNPALCVGCGCCVAVCPQRAIDIAGYSLDQCEAVIDALLAEVG